MRVMAIDLGDVRVGLAVSDPTGSLCGDAWTLHESDMKKAAAKIAAEAKARGVGRLILGHPKNMDGSTGPRAEQSAVFKAMLEAICDVPVILWDERLTTVDAHRILHESGKRMKKHRAVVDAVAASLILEGYLGTGNR
ncbi:MAG: Holliday junction resolvase RuvX [Firmicutes bacterium]|nr:Holliday junction resolvase RuvX [Bacillota bacterium]